MNRSQLDFTLLKFGTIAEHLRLADVFDILVCAVLIYAALLWLRERTSYAVAVAFLVAGGLYISARYFEMYLTLQVFRLGLPVLVIVLVVVFQDDLRRAVERFFGWRPWVKRQGNLTSEVIDTLIETVAQMADQQVGALIVLRGRESLERHCRGGILIDGLLSTPLLQSIFHASTPGHDGAIIVSGSRIERFAVHLPLSSNRKLLGASGTRHAAGLGLSERCDALIIIVSEERGTVSVANESTLSQLEVAAELRPFITTFREETDVRVRHKPFHWVRRHLELKLASLAVASVLWLSWVSDTDSVQQSFGDIPVVLQNLPEGWEIGKVDPDKVRIWITGTERAFDFLDKDELAVKLDLSNPAKGMQSVPVSDDRLSLPSGLSLTQSEPEQIRLWLFRVFQKEVPIRLLKLGSPSQKVQIRDIEIRPAKLKVIISEDLAKSDHEATVELNWDQVDFSSQPVRIQSRIILPVGVRRQPNEPETVAVLIHWKTAPETP